MSNLTNNRVNAEMSAAQIAAVKAALQVIDDNLPFLVSLSTAERVALPKINVVNKAFTEDALVAAENNASMLPPYLSTAHIRTDLNLYTQLDEVTKLMGQLQERIVDTQMLAGSEAYVGALTVYRLIGSAAQASMPGMDIVYGELRDRFKQAGGTNTNDADTRND